MVADLLVHRPAEEELPRVASLVIDSYVGGGLIAPDNPYVAELADVRGRWLDADLLVVRGANGVVVGTVTFCLAGTPWAEISRPGESEFRMLAVDPASRRRGVGRLLVRACLDRALRSGSSALVMSTTPRMTAAHRMYERMGFVRIPERDWYPRTGVHLWVYRRAVPG